MSPMPFWTRYDDPTPPTPRSAARDFVVRGLLPSVAIGAANVALGRWLVRREGLRERETEMILTLRGERTRTKDVVAKVASTLTDVPESVLHGLIATALLQRGTKQWWVAALPGVALVLEAWMYVAAGALVNRPRPDVPKLDHEQPTSSFPSGHQGATVALAVVYWGLAGRVQNPALRTAIRTACVSFPAVLGWSRTYVGMHYPSDVAVGTANGLATGLLAWNYLRRDA
ncbi:MAG TPA: phospholipid phosphatase [Propionibacteriaceae bacterium]|nr:phospholipid phosphatase [Propionibacteriaceae bacterium]